MLKKQSTNAKQHFDVDYTDFVGYVSEKKRLIFIYKCICCGCFVVAYVSNIKQPSFPTPFYSVLVSISVFMALSTVFYSINSPYSSPFSHSGLSDLISVLLVRSIIYFFMKVSFSPDVTFTGLKAPTN